MENKLEQLIRIIYKKWKSDNPASEGAHPDEEEMVCFREGKLSLDESDRIKTHLISCAACAEALMMQISLKEAPEREVPEELLRGARNLVSEGQKASILEIYLRLKENFLELISTTGDILVGQELLPAPVLRSRQIKDFKDEITILKDFQNIRVEIKIENKAGEAFDLAVLVKEKDTQKTLKDLRITLLKDGLELESSLSDSGRVVFEHVLLGRYTVEISSPENKLAAVLLEIKT